MMPRTERAARLQGVRFSQPARVCSWYTSRWFQFSLVGTVSLAVFTGLETGAPPSYLFGQVFLGLGVYLSLFLLANRQLLDPVQAVVAVFYWWFGVGPAVVASWYYLLRLPDQALEAQVSGMEPLWIVAPGLIIYAIAARTTLNWLSKTKMHARFLLPAGESYRPRVLVIYLAMAGLSALALSALLRLGFQGQVETSFFGGTQTNIWWVGVIAAAGSVAPFATSALMTSIAGPWKGTPLTVKILVGLVAAQTIVFAVLGGWKSPLAVLGAYYSSAYLTRRQRPPWVFLAVGALVFIAFITPFVNYARNAAVNSGAADSSARKEVFSQVLTDPLAFLPRSLEAMDPAVFFRGISSLAGEVTRRAGPLEGEWHGYTVVWGLEILVPRAIMRDKRETNIGNFFSRTVAADIGVSGQYDALNSVAISIPFEIVGNFGWCAGVLSFGVIGVLWSVLCGWLLSPGRLSNHPLTAFLTVSTMGLEAPLGHYMAGLRDLLIPLVLCFVVYELLRGRV